MPQDMVEMALTVTGGATETPVSPISPPGDSLVEIHDMEAVTLTVTDEELLMLSQQLLVGYD